MRFRLTYDKRKNLAIELSVYGDAPHLEFDKVIDAIRSGEYSVEREVTVWDRYE